MPRTRRASKPRFRDWTIEDAEALLEGMSFTERCPDPHAMPGTPRTVGHEIAMGLLRAAWAELRDVMLPIYIARYPGRRPWVWWECDAPEPRRCVSGPGNFALRDPEAEPWSTRLYFGAPCVIRREDIENPSSYECQWDFLDRLDLLEPAERAIVEGPAWDPWAIYSEGDVPVFDEPWISKDDGHLFLPNAKHSYER